ncbi:MAG: M23 family metallopeptidase [Proteobacteria bacterium]|nr:M23 family metallopeptidase [Pseudomonadota bacterium]MBU1708787.1 M23 family metallopeptidase [Pseudomonadota bacterium]
MKKKLHIIITGEEGEAKTFVISKLRLKALLNFTLATFFILSLLSFASINLFMKGSELESTVHTLKTTLQTTQKSNFSLQEKVTTLDKEKEELLNGAVNELNKKSKLIESVLSTVGIAPKTKESKENSGGPFTRLPVQNAEDILFTAEHYLETIQSIPLGPPFRGIITSKFGRRVDPLNGQPAFHEGIDIRGKMGTPIKATANGKVLTRGYNSGYGWFLVIDHNNGFRSKFCHLKKILVQQGETITRGQKIALLGNSGRSTGPHLHYEIHNDDKIINPTKFLTIANYIK